MKNTDDIYSFTGNFIKNLTDSCYFNFKKTNYLKLKKSDKQFIKKLNNLILKNISDTEQTEKIIKILLSVSVFLSDTAEKFIIKNNNKIISEKNFYNC